MQVAPEAAIADPVTSVALEFRQAMRRLATTVCVTTTRATEHPIGMTMTSVTSVSMDPPTVLICVHHSSRLGQILRVSSSYCINFLHSSQHEIAQAFGGALDTSERFSVGEWNLDYESAPYLETAQASVFCELESAAAVGTHIVIVGRVKEVRLFGEPEPLIYSDGRYAALGAGVVGF